ncbi:MAG: hypothetical protein KAW92_11885 [Candidatus Cloacimonetes bacterium]|nr:hypothetical protein [Candidatus Cloacimonadota bacterium]
MTTYYIRKPPNGNDGNDGLSKDTAWATLSKANDTLNHGDTLIIGGGDYTEESLSSGKRNLTVIGDYDGSLTGDSGWVKMLFLNLIGYNNSEDTFITVRWIWTVGYVANENIIGSMFAVGPGKETQTIEHLVVENQSQRTIVYGCGAVAKGFVTLNTCWFHGEVRSRSGRIYVKSCTFTCDLLNSSGCHYFGGEGGVDFIIKIKNCIFKATDSNSNYAMISFGGVDIDESTIDIDYNDYYVPNGAAIVYSQGNYYHTIQEWQNGVDFDWSNENQNSIEINPNFKDDGYHLEENSPCIDVGIAYGLNRDIDNEPRPNSFAYDIGCDEWWPATSEDNFEFEPSRKGPILIRNTPYREPQLKWPCTHYLSGIQYTLYTCPRCLGKGYYYDIKFDAGGLVPQVWDETKLQQELEKITLTEYNPFHPEYGAGLKKRVGQVGVDELKAIIKSDLVDAVYNLMKYQKAEANKGVQNGNFSPKELIDKIDKIEITELSATELNFAVYVVTVEGKELEITGKILV